MLANFLRYIFNPRIDGYIDNTEATLDLAKCCIWYLCHSHYDPWITDEEITDSIVSGDYRLHEYAVTMWVELIKRYVSLNGSKPLSSELISALECLLTERSNNEFVHKPELASRSDQLYLEKFESQWPELYTMLCRIAHFRWRCSSSEYRMSKGEMSRLPCDQSPPKIQLENAWTGLDPLTVCHISISIYIQFDGLLCGRKKHKDGCNCWLLERHYGKRPFKCDVLGCSFRRHGFTTSRLRDSHVRHHDRPWKCAVQSCEYAEIGFLSRRMRDEHLDSGHREVESQVESLSSNLDIDEIQPLFFDLIRLDKVEAVKSILPHFSTLSQGVRSELDKLTAFSGSASMAQVLFGYDDKDPDRGWRHREFLAESIRGKNFETLRWSLSRIDKMAESQVTVFWDAVLLPLIQSGSLEMYQECKEYLIDAISTQNIAYTKTLAKESVMPNVIGATAGDPNRENMLLSIWAALQTRKTTSKFHTRVNLGDALGYVAETTCSLVLAKVLCEYGADVNFRRSNVYVTPLHRAARQSSPQAAEFVKFLLYHGANPELQAGRSKLKISEEKGAKQIAKWLEMSWDELIQKVKLDRERGICPPEYM